MEYKKESTSKCQSAELAPSCTSQWASLIALPFTELRFHRGTVGLDLTTAATSFRKRENFLHGIMVLYSKDVAEYVGGVICDCHIQEYLYVTLGSRKLLKL